MNSLTNAHYQSYLHIHKHEILQGFVHTIYKGIIYKLSIPQGLSADSDRDFMVTLIPMLTEFENSRMIKHSRQLVDHCKELIVINISKLWLFTRDTQQNDNHYFSLVTQCFKFGDNYKESEEYLGEEIYSLMNYKNTELRLLQEKLKTSDDENKKLRKDVRRLSTKEEECNNCECSVCYNLGVNSFQFDCPHHTCSDCFDKLQTKICPVCRST